MISKRYEFHVFSFVMSAIMSGVMSLAMLSLELRVVTEVFMQWPSAWLVSLFVAFPTSLVVVPFTKKLVPQLITP